MNAPVTIEPLILTLRGQRVILDADWADIYGVKTKRLTEQVKRNADRFPEDFVFQLTAGEWKDLRSQFATASSEVVENEQTNRSQNATASHSKRRTIPFAFTEHGAIMASMVLHSPEATAMSVFVVRALVQMRERLAANAEILKRLAEIDTTLLEHDKALRTIWQHLQPLLEPPPDPPKRKIGFDYKEDGE